ncbi:MAG: dethiobiotin synthase [Roseimicrobium sp.]
MRIFITGTDTDAGKTYVTCLLLDAMKRRNLKAAGYKPFCCGTREDAAALQQASSDGFVLDELNPIWLKVPASPLAAGLIENRPVAIDAAKEGFTRLAGKAENVLVEGVGGWEVPLRDGYTTADFAEELALPVLLVTNNKLGALNHTLLTVRNIAARGLSCLGVVLNYAAPGRDAASISNRMILERMGIAVLGEVMHGETDGRELLDALLERHA